MVKCEYCGLEMLEADGCTMNVIKINGKWMRRIKVGERKDMMGVEPGERCHDCNALYGHCHHFGCDSETCPVCGGQVGMGCGCKVTELGMTEE